MSASAAGRRARNASAVGRYMASVSSGCMASGLPTARNHAGTLRPMNKLNPAMKRLRSECKSQRASCCMPTAEMSPNMTQ